MWPRFWLAFLPALIAGCVQLPPTPQDLAAKRFEGAPGRSVIYIVRNIPDWSSEPATITLDDRAMITTHPGTYYRWEVEPGRHKIAGFAGDSGVMFLETGPDRIYYVLQRILRVFPFTTSHFEPVAPQVGQAVVMRATLIP